MLPKTTWTVIWRGTRLRQCRHRRRRRQTAPSAAFKVIRINRRRHPNQRLKVRVPVADVAFILPTTLTLSSNSLFFFVDDCNRSETTPTSNSSSFLNDSTCHDDDDVDPPAIVIYLVEPVSIGSEDNDLNRLACLALLRCYNNVLSVIPEHIRSNVSVQVGTCFVYSILSNVCPSKFSNSCGSKTLIEILSVRWIYSEKIIA